VVTTNLKYIRRQMLSMDAALGRTESIYHIDTTKITVSSLATGGSNQKFIDQWILRSDTADSADRIRRVTNYTPAQGYLHHSGASYTDTTSTGESVEILEFEPYLYDNAVQVTLARLKHLDRTELPTVQNQRRVWLGDCDWIKEPSDVVRICWSDNPVMTRNRYLQKYNSYSSSGVLVPDSWSLVGSSATMARSDTYTRRDLPYSLRVTRSGTDCTLRQNIGLLENGVDGDSLQGGEITAVFWVWSAVASQVRAQIYDGVTTTSGSYHTGNGKWQELTVTADIGDDATDVRIQLSVEGDNTPIYVSEGYAVEVMDDTVRRDNFGEMEEASTAWNQNGTLSATLPERSRKGQWVIYSTRGYPQLDATRFSAGTADADVIDADVIKVATGSISRLYEMLAEMGQEAKYGPLSALWNARFNGIAAAHMAQPGTPRVGGAAAGLLRPLSAPVRRW